MVDPVTALLQSLIEQELGSADLNIAKVSIALGAVETPLTKKDAAQQTWPADLLVGSLLETKNISYYAPLSSPVRSASIAGRGG